MNKKIACITLDIESDPTSQKDIRLFEEDNLLERYLAIIKKNDVKVTGFIVTSLLEKYGSKLNNLSEHCLIEYGVHSHSHDQYNPCTKEEIERCYYRYQDFFKSTPLGYRAPNGLIDKCGIGTLIDYGFEYDASVFPSLRFDKYGYSNLHFPNTPFRINRGQESIIEIPFACLRTIRLVFSLSYIKLLGMSTYRNLMNLFPLPEIVVLDSHPYDFYIHLLANKMKGWKKVAHLRNANRAFGLFEDIIIMLKKHN